MKRNLIVVLASLAVLAAGGYWLAPQLYRTNPAGLAGPIRLTLKEGPKGRITLEMYPTEGDNCHVPLWATVADSQAIKTVFQGTEDFYFCKVRLTKDILPAGELDLTELATHNLVFVRGPDTDRYTVDVREEKIEVRVDKASFTSLDSFQLNDPIWRVPRETVWLSIRYPSERERKKFKPQEEDFLAKLKALGAKPRGAPPKGQYAWPVMFWSQRAVPPSSEIGRDLVFIYPGEIEPLRKLVRSYKQYYSANPHAWNLSLDVGTWQGPSFHN